MPRVPYISELPDAEPLTPEQSAALLVELGRVKTKLFEGHIPLVRQCVHDAMKQCRGDPAELEVTATEALWTAIGRAMPKGPNYFPYAYFEKWIVGALISVVKKAKKASPTFTDLGLETWDEDWQKPAPGSKAADVDAMRTAVADALPEVERKVPGFGKLYTLRADGVGWGEISRRLGEPDSTLSSRFERGKAILSKMVSEEST
jgi:hypothetical protein